MNHLPRLVISATDRLRDRFAWYSLRRTSSSARQRGQVLPIFAIMSVVLLGGAALLTDVAWWWVNQQRMQRAADAGALAGAIHLPGNQALAFSKALNEAAKNGYVNGVDGVTVTPKRDAGDPRKLIVDIDGPVGTHFAKALCWEGGPCLSHVDVGVAGAASFVLPVPMGSPQNYYGVGFLKDVVSTTIPFEDDTGWNSPTSTASGQWRDPNRAYQSGYTTENRNGDSQDWRNFGLSNEITNDPSTTIDGLQLRLRYAALTGSGTRTDCRVTTRLSWNGGGSWTDPVTTDPLTTNDVDYYLGSDSSTAAWGTHTWTRSDLTDSNFRVRLTWNDGTPGCAGSQSVRVGEIEVQTDFSGTTTMTSVQEVPVIDPDGNTLAPHGFWGALQSQGAPNIQGDAYMTYYDTRTSRTNDDYTPSGYYQYGIEFPAASSGGEVWLFDPGFCNVDSDKGTGESYTFGSPNGSSSFNPVSTFYDLYDTNNTPYDVSDDTLVYASGNTYRRLQLRDTVLDAQNPVSAAACDSLAWHNDWVRIATNLAGGHTYRLHTHSTDPGSATDQRNSTGLNAFAIWSKASGGTPRVYGLGAMEAYVRLPGGRSTEFYLAQIDAEHAGKTMVIKLWDPGDTGQLAANLQILEPTTTSYQATSFNFSAERNSYNASSCSSRSGTNVNSVITNTGGGYSNSRYNGCWLTIEIPLPNTYSAPHPSSDSVTNEGGWWKIRYNMSGSSADYSTDLTTWEVTLRGNPVHLVLQ